MELLFVSLAALLAGFVDAVVGGGGLILVPALFAAFPTTHPATLLGNNKGASVWGTVFAAWRYNQRVHLRWATLLPAAGAGFLASLAGAWWVTQVSPAHLRKALPLVLLAVLLYTLRNKALGRVHAPLHSTRRERLVALGIGGLVGFYDGFFGPGAGSFLVFLFVRLLGYDFLHASASAKLINVCTNTAAVLLFATQGHILWPLVLPLALATLLGSFLGTHLVLKHGSGFVRVVFIAVVSALILKTGWDGFLR